MLHIRSKLAFERDKLMGLPSDKHDIGYRKVTVLRQLPEKDNKRDA
jgi:hypothetical protein